MVTDDPTRVDEMLRRWSAGTGMRPGALLVDEGAEDGEPLELRCDGARLRSHPLTLLIARERASGIGLSTCRKIVELYGGEITCPPSDVGATFTFTLPAA